jgi:hypothetical protein
MTIGLGQTEKRKEKALPETGYSEHKNEQVDGASGILCGCQECWSRLVEYWTFGIRRLCLLFLP